MPEDIRIGIVGGSGLGEALLEGIAAADCREHDIDTPFGRPSAPIITGTFGGVPIALLQRHGPGHLIRPTVVPYRANVFALKALGCTHVVASGATGSLREDIAPGDLVICDQLIDRTTARPRTFFEHAAVHVEFAEPFCPVMRRWLLGAAAGVAGATVHDGGTYVCIEGPSFSTRAESHLHRQWGADLVGMTALPEARLAREAEMAYALVALPTDYDCWRPRAADRDEASLLTEIIGNLQAATAASIQLITTALADLAPLHASPSPARDALRLGIWSDRSAIDASETARLDVLWGRHLGGGG
ncbi:MAG: MTAP family purine nucleoside phosphorylase [Planctomycetota bacterium]|jgi:5'-methylthioadenosine phosphorylase